MLCFVQGYALLHLYLGRMLSLCQCRRFGYLSTYLSYCRCCEYALLVLEYWADAPEIQRSADLYEDLIKCCVGDAMSEV